MKSLKINDNFLVLLAIVAALVAAQTLDKGPGPQKWHPAIFWTAVCFSTVLYHFRRSWNSGNFWTIWIVAIMSHVLMMWLIFGDFVEGTKIGMLPTLPFALIEFIVLVVIINRFSLSPH